MATQELKSITISPTDPVISIGAKIIFNAICKDQNDDIISCPILTWNSSSPENGTIDSNGQFIAGNISGVTNITASFSGIISNTVKTHVTSIRQTMSSIEISPKTVNISVGKTQTFIAIPKDQFGNDMYDIIFTWASDYPERAIIIQDGVLTGLKEGYVRVSATANNVVGSANVYISSAEQPTKLDIGQTIAIGITILGIVTFIKSRNIKKQKD